ncbi:hypothetical protein NPIL_42731 [Nephila pilipes]|uniref:Uncharacterized protein n=1 Tax=Nephila pilipes TaxID=299642 RepID=A0A8X6NDM6_NEPPI|nr:hypothetical protein NPIL_42731 [Nephila pilipes]
MPLDATSAQKQLITNFEILVIMTEPLLLSQTLPLPMPSIAFCNTDVGCTGALSNGVICYEATNKELYLLAQSPGLNLIEQLQETLKRQLRSIPQRRKSVAELTSVFLQEWRAIPDMTLLVDSYSQSVSWYCSNQPRTNV